MESSSSSKVTVEYFDPSGVFPLISPGLLSRLPLRNLHWKSPSRPLRSIGSLHVDLTAAEPSPAAVRSSAADSDDLSRVKSFESSHSGTEDASRTHSRSQNRPEQKTVPDAGAGTFKGPVKERRHQIPGLRQTPYLKVYLLRCDDGETYKASSRRALREWIKECTPASQSSSSHNKQEKHDAFEWMIVHVVLPNTTAATQPGLSGSGSGGGGNQPDRPPSASRWPGRGSSTILEKIRADFNGSSKSSTDRVAQIRLHKTDIPPHLFTEIAGPPSSSPAVTPSIAQEERDSAWLDLVVKLKSLILTSFDLRVRQYEEDIHEKDAQRSLPGWNFCTFFVLKEGLARGFESVGLVEDALMGYDDLSMGLDDIIRDQAARGEDHGAAFLPYTEDLRRQAEGARLASRRQTAPDDDTSGDADESEPSDIPLSSFKKRYRDLILSNNISVFDFRCYVFARQMSLLLRLGNAHSSRAELMAKLKAHPSTEQHEYSAPLADEPENLTILAEVCARAGEFITAVARIMRRDLETAYTHRDRRESNVEEGEKARSGTPRSSEKLHNEREIESVIDNLVSSWIYSVSQQVLAETVTRALPIPPSSIAEMNPSSSKEDIHGKKGQEPKVAIPEPKTMMHPARVSSMQLSQNFSLGQAGPVFQANEGQRPLSQSRMPAQDTFLKSGIEELASSRADLYLLSRNIVQRLGEQRGWLQVRHASDDGPTTEMEDVELSDEADTSKPDSSHGAPSDGRSLGLHGLNNQLLRTAAKDQSNFYNLYEILSDKMLRHYTVANRQRSVQKIMSELAMLKFDLEDYGTAATYFGRLVPFYAEMGWDMVETSMLTAYVTCLKQLDRKEECVRVILELLGKEALREKEAIRQRKDAVTPAMSAYGNWHGDEAISTRGYLQDLLDYAQDLPYELVVPINKIFGEVHTSPYPRHHEDKDGFSLLVSARYVLQDSLDIESVKVRIVGTLHGHSREVWLTSKDVLTLKRGVAHFSVETNAVIPGSFVVSKVVMEAHNIFFIQETGPEPSAALSSAPAAPSTELKPCRILYYPRPESFEAKLGLSRHLNLDLVRSLEISLSTGWNEIVSGELRLRSASAGLRLRTADATVKGGPTIISKGTRPGVIEFKELSARDTVKISVPYGLERDLPELLVKIEVAYTTSNGDFLYSTIESLSILLPLGVNVQETFKREALFSKFTVSTASSIPLRVLSSKLEGPDNYQIQGGGTDACHLLVFPKQPASLIYMIRQSSRMPAKDRVAKRLMALSIEYRCLEDEISDTLEMALESSLEASPHRSVSRLLLSTLLSRTFGALESHDYEAIGLSGEVHLPAFATMGWSDMLDNLAPSSREALVSWLKAWHDAHTVIQLPLEVDSTTKNRTIIIPVELPQVQVVHTAELHLPGLEARHGSHDTDQIALVGQVIAAELTIQHTRVWDNAQPSGGGKALDFIYEIHGNMDHWLIGGQKRIAFTAKENEVHSFPVMLIPLRPGHLLLPHVEIHPQIVWPRRAGATGGDSDKSNQQTGLSPRASHRPSSSLTSPINSESSPASPEKGQPARSNGLATGEGEQISCETDYRNQGQAILAIPDVKSATISLEPGVATGTARLIDADRRSAHVVR